MEDSIQKLMINGHRALEFSLNKLEQQLRRNLIGDAKRTFDRFEWALKRHFLIEEKAIFIFLNQENGKEISSTFNLMQEHGNLLELLKIVKEEINFHGTADVSRLKESLLDHSRFENEEFYPRLDKELSYSQKEEILEKIEKSVKSE